ncbi:MAG: NeuD/PglB/VioB family sugar acetyltransferase [Sphingopyxis sp.]
MSAVYGIYGTGGCGRGVMPLLRAGLAGADVKLVFIDDAPRSDRLNGHEIWTFDRFVSASRGSGRVALAVADARLRALLDRRCVAAGLRVTGVTAANAVVMDDVEIGLGALLSPFVTLTSNIRIGRCFHANLYSYVEHDCVIGDYVTFAPGVHCNGNVVIGDHAYIGSGAIIRQGLRIGARAIVGMGAVVTKDVPEGLTVIGNPARPMER